MSIYCCVIKMSFDWTSVSTLTCSIILVHVAEGWGDVVHVAVQPTARRSIILPVSLPFSLNVSDFKRVIKRARSKRVREDMGVVSKKRARSKRVIVVPRERPALERVQPESVTPTEIQTDSDGGGIEDDRIYVTPGATVDVNAFVDGVFA